MILEPFPNDQGVQSSKRTTDTYALHTGTHTVI